MPTTFFILAGEASGDLHAARLMRAISSLDPGARFVGMGGRAMTEAGLVVAKDLEGMQVVGFWEVAKKYGFFKRVFYQLLDRIKQERPAALICVDYPGFNLRFAKEVKKLGIPVLYYIVPQVWAWKPLRAKKMAQFVDRAFCVFEFEPPFFEKFGLKTTFVGHPLIDRGMPVPSTSKAFPLKLSPGRKTVAFLPGSRARETASHWKPMCDGFSLARKKITDIRAVISLQSGTVSRATMAEIEATLNDHPVSARDGNAPIDKPQIILAPRSEVDAHVVESVNASALEHTPLLASAADFSIVKSGTSTLEAGLAGHPMCVVYRGSWASYTIAHMLVNIPVFSLVNIVLGRYVVPELLQSDVNPQRIAQEIERGLTDERYREQQKAALAELPKKLGGPGASQRAAQGILDFLKGKA
jgi:lipid-A-disaccharide synthase